MRKRTILKALPAIGLMTILGVTAPALAERDRGDRHGNHSSHRDRGDRDHGRHGGGSHRYHGHHGHRRHHGHDRSGLSISFGTVFSEPCRTVTYRESGYYESRWVPAVYETRYDHCGRPYSVLVCEGYYQRVWIPGECRTTTYCSPPRYSHSGIRISGHVDF